ncbi:MAG: CoA-transferase [Candidatus Rokuibacteriota bacterium]
MRDALASFVPDGASVCMGAALEALIPFAAGHELIRQGRRDLELVGPISDILFDQLVGAGCARKVTAAWVGNVSAGLGHNYRRAVEAGVPRPLEVEDHSNLTLATALQAGALGAPYIPTRSLLGTDLLRSNPRLRPATDPFSGAPVVLVPALAPDVAILHVQRADADGHAHVWGTLGVTRQAALAARRVVLVAEEVWPRERILSDPNLVLAPPFKVAAVVHQPWGAYPSPVQGHYARDHDFYRRYHDDTRTPEGSRRWLDRWVTGIADWPGFLGLVGRERLDALRATRPAPSEPLDFGG